MQVELDKEELGFLIESLRYAEISFDHSISQYPEGLRTLYYRRFYQAKKRMFQKLSRKLHNAKRR